MSSCTKKLTNFKMSSRLNSKPVKLNEELEAKEGKDSLGIIVTALYCKMLVILGIAFPMAETITDRVPRGFYHLFYVYLFIGSLFFLLFVYIDDLCRQRKIRAMQPPKPTSHWVTVRLQLRRSRVGLNQGPSNIPTPRRNMLSQRPKNVYGSFYLRLGALLFGVGTMIYSAIEIGLFFETSYGQMDEECRNYFATLRPFLQTVFVFVQMYFIFLNLKMNVYRRKLISRMGLMHMIATNLCVWLSVLVNNISNLTIMETTHEIESANPDHGDHSLNKNNEEHHDNAGPSIQNPHFQSHEFESLPSAHSLVQHVMTVCRHEHNVMGSILIKSAPFLFPCTIEYSLICAAVLYMMWKHIDEEHEWTRKFRIQTTKSRRDSIQTDTQDEEYSRPSPLKLLSESKKFVNYGLESVIKIEESDDEEQEEQRENQAFQRHQTYSVDCSRANNGLFCGIFITVVTIITIVVFFVLIGSKDQALRQTAITLGSVTELALYSLSTAAVLIGIVQVRQLKHYSSQKLELDTLLLIVAQTGVFLYSTFSIIGSFFSIQDHLISFLGSMATVVQTTLQTIFILDASSRHASTVREVKRKPGREIVTFLLVCNLAMWAIRSLETNRADSHPIQSDFYGGGYIWPIITHVSMPLAIFYRFHSTVCLCGIWTKTFKYKENEYEYSE